METLIRDLRDHYQPIGKVEEMLVEKVAIEYARYARVLGAEQQVLARQHPFFYVTVDRFARYATSTNRALSRAIEDLERVQAARNARASAAAGTGGTKSSRLQRSWMPGLARAVPSFGDGEIRKEVSSSGSLPRPGHRGSGKKVIFQNKPTDRLS